MVAMVVNNSNMLHFRAVWKFPGMSIDRGEYFAPSLAELARILFKSEGVCREEVEHVYVHQIQKDGSCLEIIAIDKTTTPNINPHLIWSKVTGNKQVASSPYDWEEWEAEENYEVEDGHDEHVMAEVYEILQAQSKSSKPHIKVAIERLSSKPDLTVKQGSYTAVPAVVKKEN